MVFLFLIRLIKKLISLAIVPRWFARGLLNETSPRYIRLKSTLHISWFQVSANDKQAVVKNFSIKAVRSSGETYSKLTASFPHNLSKVTGGTRKAPTVEVVQTNLLIPATDEADYNLVLFPVTLH